jgi:hypothetical protein
VVASGFEIGAALRLPASSLESDFAYAPNHPVADAYRLYRPPPYDKASYDLTSVLYGVRPDAGYFDLSDEGIIQVDEEGFTHFRRVESGKYRYLRLGSDAQRHRALEAMIHLASQPPCRCR